MYRRCIMRDIKKSSLDKDSPEVNRRLTMKYTKEERLDIGRRIYDISEQTARDYMRLYRDTEQLPPKRAAKSTITAPSFQTNPVGMEELESMTKEQLIQEVVKARITEARLKKGYEVKGDGTVILYGNGNTK